MRKYFFLFIFICSFLYSGAYYEVDTYGNIRSSGTLTIGQKIITPRLEANEIITDTITYQNAQVDKLRANKISVYDLDIQHSIFNSTGSEIMLLSQLLSFEHIICPSLATQEEWCLKLHLNDLYSYYGSNNPISLHSPLDLLQQDILNFVVENVSDFPSDPRPGRLVFRNGGIYWWDGAEWRCIQAQTTEFDQYIKKLYPSIVLLHRDNNNEISYTSLDLLADYEGAHINVGRYNPSVGRTLRFSADDFLFQGTTVTVLNLNSTYGIISSTALIAGITFEDNRIKKIMHLVGLGEGIIKMIDDIDIIPPEGHKMNVWGNIDMKSNHIKNVGSLQVVGITASSITANDIEVNFGIKSSTAYVAGMTFYNQSIQGNNIIVLFGNNGSRLQSGSGASLKVYSDIDIIPAVGYKTNVYSDLDMRTKNITNVNQLNANTIITNYVSATSSITTNEIRASTVYNDIYILHLHGSGGVVLGSLDGSAKIKVYKNDDIILEPSPNYTINLFISSTTTAGTLAGYMTIKVNNQTYKVPLYNP